MNNTHGLSMERKIFQHRIKDSDDFGLRNPASQIFFQRKTATSTAARVNLGYDAKHNLSRRRKANIFLLLLILASTGISEGFPAGSPAIL